MARVKVRVEGEDAGASAALEKVEKKAGGLGNALEKADKIAKGTLVGLAGLAVGAAKLASDVEQSAGAVESIYGEHAAGVQAMADQAAQTVGLAKAQYQDLAAVLGAQLKNMGVPMGELSGQTDQLITLGADLAATFGGTTADAVAALSSLMRGERDPIERYGVSIKEADVAAQKAKMGLSGLTGEADRAATTQATLALLNQQTASAQGAFAREADTAAGALERAKAEATNTGAALGEALLPLVVQAGGALQGMAQFARENAQAVQVVALVLGGLAAAVVAYNGVMAAVPAIQAAVTAAQWLWNLSLWSSPITWVVAGIVALIAVIVLLVTHWGTVVSAAQAAWSVVVGAAQAMGAAVSRFAGLVGAVIVAAFNRAMAGPRAFLAAVMGLAASATAAVSRLANLVGSALSSAWSAAVSAAVRFGSAVMGALRPITSFVSGLASRIAGLFGAARGVANTVGRLFASEHPHGPRPARWWGRPPADLALAAGDPLSWRLVGARHQPAGQPAPAVHITITGALDPRAVARQVRDLLNDDARTRGVVALNQAVVA